MQHWTKTVVCYTLLIVLATHWRWIYSLIEPNCFHFDWRGGINIWLPRFCKDLVLDLFCFLSDTINSGHGKTCISPTSLWNLIWQQGSPTLRILTNKPPHDARDGRVSFININHERQTIAIPSATFNSKCHQSKTEQIHLCRELSFFFHMEFSIKGDHRSSTMEAITVSHLYPY